MNIQPSLPDSMKSNNYKVEELYSLPLPDNYSKEITESYKGGEGLSHLSFRKINDGWGMSMNEKIHSKIRDGRINYFGKWFPSPKTIVRNLVTFEFILYIKNYEKKEATIKIDYEFDINKPTKEVPINHANLDIRKIPYSQTMQKSLSDFIDKELKDAEDYLLIHGDAYSEEDFYHFLGIEVISTQESLIGSKIYKSNDEDILFIFGIKIDFHSHKFFENMLQYEVAVLSTLDINVYGLREQ